MRTEIQLLLEDIKPQTRAGGEEPTSRAESEADNDDLMRD